MSNTYNLGRDHIIEELNKQREVQKELIARKGMLSDYIGIANRDYDDVVNRLQELDEKIKELRGKL